ncbi:BamA/TamA family outer membrane protein [Altererythrobacter sp. H2]|uniref:autotransporter assembly complex protein TamA n=1 Tax=Altererythrobacter sp. H2 TaxID=3108391 RepID=UPI002B4BDC75|nr:BamA/TamA family outer membrane protein [Altererythrobacter sp. H2]WRK95372.1 BamA/TamA family outer membrane protein [Altererythrobacter sp. H2]
MIVAAACVCLAGPLAAQAVSASPDASLDELIPDAAVSNPEGWATEAEPAEPEPELDPSSPMDDSGEFAVEWPDDVDLPELVELQPDNDIEFAEIDLPQQPVTARANLVEIDPTLVLALPEDEALFPVRDDFLRRFSELSTIEELSANSDNIAQLAARARADEALLGDLLRAFGYYDGQVIRSVAGSDAEGDAQGSTAEQPQVRFDIVPGARYRFGEVNLGALGTAPDAEALRAAFEIQSGDFLSSYRIVEEQFDLDVALGETGYPFAAIADPELLIDHDRTEGDLTLLVTPGGKYVFGEVTSDRPRFLSGRHLATIARFEPGDTYQRSLEMDLRRAVTATGLVSTVTVTKREVAPPTGDQPGVVALDVAMEPARLRTVAGAIGYGSEEGFRVEASWEHRNLFPPEGALRLRGILGTQEQLIGATFRRNNFGGRDKVFAADAFVSTIDNVAFNARTVALRASYERLSTLLFQKPLSWAVGAEVLATGERNQVIGERPRPRQTYFIGSMFGRATIDGTDSLLDPRTGFRLSGFLAPEYSRTLDNDYTYLRAQADASYYRPVGERLVLAGRVRAATVQGAELEGIAPSRRLYAGGGSSVRGYGFQAVGPKTIFGEPVGGRSLVEASVEARIDTGFFDGALQVVPFLDAASVSTSSTPDFREIKYGAGLGVRYKTSFGPIRVDVGVPLNPDPEDSPVAVYVSLGQAF